MGKNEYRLIIDISGNGTNGGAISKSEKTKNSAKKGAEILTAYNIAKPYLNATKQIIQNEVDTRFGSGELSQRIGIAMDIASFGANAIVSMASGSSLAMALGLSSGLGIAAGALLAVGNAVTNVVVRQNEINNKSKIENEQLNILRGRAGIQFNRSRSGE